MDIDINDNTQNIFKSNLNGNNPTANINEIINNDGDTEMNIFQKNNKCFYGSNNSPLYKKNKKSSCVLTLCEGRLQNDLAELKRSKIFGKICEIRFESNYRKVEENKLEFLAEFVSFFTVKFTFNSDYPCSPPIITYVSGLKPNHIFDDNGNVLIKKKKKKNWTPSIWLSTLVYSIELLISSGINCNNYDNNNGNNNLTNYFLDVKKKKYGKRNWDTYLDEMNNYYDKESAIIPELEKTLKQLKIK